MFGCCLLFGLAHLFRLGLLFVWLVLFVLFCMDGIALLGFGFSEAVALTNRMPKYNSNRLKMKVLQINI